MLCFKDVLRIHGAQPVHSVWASHGGTGTS